MSADHHEDELAAEQTAGFKVGEKKTIDEYKNLGKYVFLNSICFPYAMVSGTVHYPPTLSSEYCQASSGGLHSFKGGPPNSQQFSIYSQ